MMEELDYDWLKRIDEVHDKLDRGVPITSKNARCTKEILIDRYFKFLTNRAFKLKIPMNNGKYVTEKVTRYKTFYAFFNKTKHTIRSCNELRDGEVYYSYGVQKYNGWNDQEFDITFMDEKCDRQHFKLHWNDILKIKYEEISLQKYWEIVSLFVDMEPGGKNETADECKHYDHAQGKHYCCSPDQETRRCFGITCGSFKPKT